MDAKIEKTVKCSRSDESCLLIPVLALAVKIHVCKCVIMRHFVTLYMPLTCDVLTILPVFHCRSLMKEFSFVKAYLYCQIIVDLLTNSVTVLNPRGKKIRGLQSD